jgi:hypothetical protein
MRLSASIGCPWTRVLRLGSEGQLLAIASGRSHNPLLLSSSENEGVTIVTIDILLDPKDASA